MSQKLFELTMTVNDKVMSLNIQPHKTLLDVLREHLHLTGTKRGCNVGKCGACTVLLDGQPIYSCVFPAVQAHNHHITTIEGIKADGDNLHPVQEAFIEADAVQCGYCTPGMIMSTVALFDQNPQPDEEAIQQLQRGHICRCGSYLNWHDAIQLLIREHQAQIYAPVLEVGATLSQESK